MVSDMGWLRSVGSRKLYVSFAEYSLFYRALLQKRPIILSILLTEATAYEASHRPLGGGFVWWKRDSLIERERKRERERDVRMARRRTTLVSFFLSLCFNIVVRWSWIWGGYD